MADSTRLFSEIRIDKLRQLFGTSDGTDMRFVCGGMTKDVHSFVLQLGSKVLGTMCTGAFQEGLNGRIELKDHEPHLAYRMLQHLYMVDYSAGEIEIDGMKEESFVSELHTHVMMYAMADEYDVRDLKKEALWKFGQELMTKARQTEALATVLEVVPAIYATTPESDRRLRDLVVLFGALYLMRIKDLPELGTAITHSPDYIIEVLQKFEQITVKSGKTVIGGVCYSADY